MKLFLIGYMGCGKSTLGRRLARRMDVEFIDMDRYIESEAGATIPEIFASRGEAEFRRLERQAITNLGKRTDDCIIATGGGAPCREGNIEAINHAGTSIYLKMPHRILVARLCRNKSKRPLIAGKTDREVEDFVARSLAEREPFYSQASITIDCDGRSDDYIVEHIVRHLENMNENNTNTK